MKFIILVFLSCVLVTPAKAYKLRLNTIVKQMIRNNGRKSPGYKIVREVSFEANGQSQSARETWWVKNGDRMKVQVESVDPAKPWSFEIVYNGGARQTLSSSNQVKSFKVSKEFFEPLFHDRSETSLKQRLVQFQFIPEWAKNLPAPDYVRGKTVMKDEKFIGLVPGTGAVSYLIGAPKNADGTPGHTHLWVEQDTFKISKGKLASKSEFTNKEFQDIDGGLKLPRTQVISWADRVARVRVITAEKKRLSSTDLALSTSKSTTVPDQPILKEFYSRFR